MSLEWVVDGGTRQKANDGREVVINAGSSSEPLQSENAEFERFEGLTRTIVRVSKDEVDEKRRKAQD